MVCLCVITGLSLLKKMSGQICRACHRFFINVEDAKTHCRTLMHYNNFVALVKEKVNYLLISAVADRSHLCLLNVLAG